MPDITHPWKFFPGNTPNEKLVPRKISNGEIFPRKILPPNRRKNLPDIFNPADSFPWNISTDKIESPKRK